MDCLGLVQDGGLDGSTHFVFYLDQQRLDIGQWIYFIVELFGVQLFELVLEFQVFGLLHFVRLKAVEEFQVVEADIVDVFGFEDGQLFGCVRQRESGKTLVKLFHCHVSMVQPEEKIRMIDLEQEIDIGI